MKQNTKMKCSFFKNYTFWLVTILYLEFIFSFLTYETFYKSNIINIFIFSNLIATICCLLTSIINNKVNNIIKYILLFIFAFYFSLQFVFHNVFESYFSFSLLGLSDQLTSFANETINAIFQNFIIIILFFTPFILSIILRKKITLKKFNILDSLLNILFIIIAISLLLININIQKNKSNSIYDLLFKVNENALNIEKLGVLPSSFIDVYRAIFGFEVEIINVEQPQETPSEEIEYNILELNFKDTKNNKIKQINNYIQSLSATEKNIVGISIL